MPILGAPRRAPVTVCSAGSGHLPCEGDARVDAGRQYGRAKLAAGDAHPQVLSGLFIQVFLGVSTNDPVRVPDDLLFEVTRPAFEDDDLVELLPLGLVHVHDEDA